MVSGKDIPHLRVLTAGSNIYTDLTDTMKLKVVASDRFVATKDSWDKVHLSIKHKPLFSPYYVVEVYMTGLSKDTVKDIVKYATTGYAQFIFLFSNFKDFEDMEKISDIRILTYNGYRPPDKVLYNYISDRVSFPLEEAFFWEIKYRLAGNYNLIDHYIEKLNVDPPKDLKALKKIVPRINRTSLWRFFLKVLERADSKSVYKVVSEYEFGGKFLLQYLQTQVTNLITLYKFYMQGTFNRRTLNEFGNKNKDLLKKLGFREYQLSDILDIYNNHSFEELIQLKEILDKGFNSGKEIGYSYALYQTVTELINIKMTIRIEQWSLTEE